MRKTRPSGSVEGVMGNHDPYSDRLRSRKNASSTRDDRRNAAPKEKIDSLGQGEEPARQLGEPEMLMLIHVSKY
jgi:hypothetical protein